MRKRLTSQGQLRFRWEGDNSTWEHLPTEQQECCQGLLSQLLRIVAEDQIKRSDHNERQDRCHTS